MADDQAHDEPDGEPCNCDECNDCRSEHYWRLLVDHSEVEAEQALEHYRTPHDLHGRPA